MAMLECKHLTKNYGAVCAVSGLDLSLEAGQIVGLLGPNGSGKTTLIKIAAGLLRPSDGSLFIDGKQPGRETRSIVSYLPDRDFLPAYMNVEQLLGFYEDFFADFNRDKADDMLQDLNLSYDMKLKKMSKGTKEKIQLILTMSRRAKVYLLDEPIAGVDPAARDYILKTIITNYDPKAMVLISTHLIADVEPVLDDIVFIEQGQVIMHDAADTMRESEGRSIDKLFREVFKC
ncbi:MAG: ABC transporter ATP-binding protein [Eubacteriales bacterium]|nr:ABC transporter ATP-binding protein [Eubacteriales bacterium]